MSGSQNNDHYCYGCLLSEPGMLSLYKLQNDTLKNVFQVENAIILCFMCKRLAQKAELFVQDIQRNQTLLENLQDVCIIKKNDPSTLQLSYVSMDAINLDPNNESHLDEFIVNTYGKFGVVDVKLDVKEEGKDELIQDGSSFVFHDDVDDLDGDELDDERGVSTIKQEYDDAKLEEDDSKTLLEIKLQLGDNSQHRSNIMKNSYKIKKKIKKEQLETVSGVGDAQKVHITLAQCLREREGLAAALQHNNYAFRCDHCVRGFHVEENYRRHMMKHHESAGAFPCSVCGVRMRSGEALAAHVRRRHQTRWRCTACGALVSTRARLTIHYRDAHTEEELPCQHCPRVFTRRLTLRKHVSYAHAHRPRVECHHCGKSFVNKGSLRNHIATRHDDVMGARAVARPHVCAECGAAFAAPSQLRNHGVKHSSARAHYCVECDKSFKSDASLKQHLKTTARHISSVELPLACAHCERRFAVRRDLERHTNRVHLNRRPHACDSCDRAYVNLWSLTEHRKRAHEGVRRPRKYSCPMCDKTFDRNHILVSHVRTHTGERPFACSQCAAAFAQRSVLATHVRLVHLRLTRDGRPRPPRDRQ